MRCVAERIQTHVRSYDKVGRFGGEEFLVVIPRTSEGEALALCDRICKGVGEEPIQIADLALTVTVSIGVVVANTALETAASLQGADEALYRAKAKGRNRVEVGQVAANTIRHSGRCFR